MNLPPVNRTASLAAACHYFFSEPRDATPSLAGPVVTESMEVLTHARALARAVRRIARRPLLHLACAALAATAMTPAPALARLLPRPAELSAPAPRDMREFADGASYALCFTPDGASCQALLVEAIQRTRRSLLVQAYSFTNKTIARALLDARKRGVEVRVIVDKSQISERYTSATFLHNQGIEVLVDKRPAIAHNKVMIFDHEAVFTGSFNFTKSAEERNTENGILIRGDAQLVKRYVDNWYTRERLSLPY
ncbi:phospholipase D-like protein [Cupriavidus gilardii J11]|uniref:phospholipase D n=1 Tax=Cupriavidus gilardii J11 TaxID=936133 RepID=A0A562B944_9BURK|nr:phospholipase D family protein [Cupriavidus gilardii]TWG81489.1 phospholipase D-like protein [Cupriavidus gilardii J11]